MAENYHQKYYLQLIKELAEDYKRMYPDFKDFINSTSAARVNGYVKRQGTSRKLNENIDLLGLSEKGKAILLDIVNG